MYLNIYSCLVRIILSFRRKYERVNSQNMPSSITVNEYELSMFIY
jgi:hypothetical protein